jgi:protein translocase SecG subunit
MIDTMLQTILLVAMILISVSLTAVILLQRSEGGALGMGGGPSGFMTARGAGNLLTRATSVLAVLFFVCATTNGPGRTGGSDAGRTGRSVAGRSGSQPSRRFVAGSGRSGAVSFRQLRNPRKRAAGRAFFFCSTVVLRRAMLPPRIME